MVFRQSSIEEFESNEHIINQQFGVKNGGNTEEHNQQDPSVGNISEVKDEVQLNEEDVEEEEDEEEDYEMKFPLEYHNED
jgi:hypothetical protein